MEVRTTVICNVTLTKQEALEALEEAITQKHRYEYNSKRRPVGDALDFCVNLNNTVTVVYGEEPETEIAPAPAAELVAVEEMKGSAQ